ncbi:hypothetical protein [Streptomyces sp. NPDC050704]|uniref:hypothetical protein n=1 Tax=Streptomyces sp. NPDC050704 TaxID=3157219 RepID=UPI00342FABE3
MSGVMTTPRREQFAEALLHGVASSGRSGTVLRTSGVSAVRGKHGGVGFGPDCGGCSD